ncbi:MAG: arsenite methyltransferase [Methanospirillum sp.]
MSEERIDETTLKAEIRERYGSIAREGGSCCGAAGSCGGSPASDASRSVGYSEEDLSATPDGANLGLGCGNPVAIASVREGETVLDLGSGGGFDAFLAAQRVGASGRVIGVDMTADMIDLARANAERGGYSNVEFRRGEIENLPVDDASIDLIISNCVINLAPDKGRVFAEAFRVLKPGGRFMVSDTVLQRPLSEETRTSVSAYVGCASGALRREEYLALLRAAGFSEVGIVKDAPIEIGGYTYMLAPEDRDLAGRADVIAAFEDNLSSITVTAIKGPRSSR